MAAQNAVADMSMKSVVIGETEYRLPRVTAPVARKLQLRISKTIGAPFIMGMQSGMAAQDEFAGSNTKSELDFLSILSQAFSGAIPVLNQDDVVDLMSDMIGMTYSNNARTNHDNFDYNQAYDVELAVWVGETLFGNFIGALQKSPAVERIKNLVFVEEEAKSEED